MNRGDRLFSTSELGDVLDRRTAEARAEIMQLQLADVEKQDDDAIVQRLTRRCSVSPLHLHVEKMTREGPREVEMELTGHQAFLYGEGPVVVRGIEITFLIPFGGDAWLFNCRPRRWTTVYPFGDIRGQEYRLTLRDPEQNADRVGKERDSQLQLANEYIKWQTDQIRSFNEKLPRLIQETIAQRREQLKANQAFADAFDVPEHVSSSAQAVSVLKQHKRDRDRTMKKPRVFICHASKDANVANMLFDELTSVGVDAWLDKRKLVHGDDWEHEIKNAVSKSDAIVVCLSPGFDEIGFRQKEVRWALDALDLRPIGKGFVIPFIVGPCDLPAWSKRFHAGDLSKPTKVEEIIRAIEKHCAWTRT